MESTRCLTLALLILGEVVMSVVSLINPIPLPKDLDLCLEYRNNTISNFPAHMTQSFCMSQFLVHRSSSDKPKVNFTTDETNYLNSLFRQILADSDDTSGTGRVRRQASRRRRRYRQEIRAAPFRQWPAYVAGVRRLKRERSSVTGRSRYDTIAAIHRIAVDSVHFGPAFLPWHKLYLLIFETALGVPIPYWDPTIDNAMRDPTQSIVWTSKYFGNGRGPVVSGPFRGSLTPTGPLMRDIGNDGMLFSKQNLGMVLRRLRNAEIFEPSIRQMDSLEGQHNLVHFWIGGHTNDFELSAYDPLFFNLHSYVDLVWEVFRDLQRTRGINPTADIVGSFTFNQSPYRPAIGIPGVTIRDGYSSRFRNLVGYGEMPRCPACGNSPDMTCHRTRRVCVSARGNFRRVRRTRVSPLRLASVFSRRPWMALPRMWRGKRSSKRISVKKYNNEDMNSNFDISEYAFLKIKVIRDNLHPENQTSSSQSLGLGCIQHPINAQNHMIYVQADGLNYKGRYKDVSEVNESTVYDIGIQNPMSNHLDSEVFISAFDRCGRICTPHCLTKPSETYPVYKSCSGALRVTAQEPLMYVSYHTESEFTMERTKLTDQVVPILFRCMF